MKNSFYYFENRECQYYPCHKGMAEMNCLFCYCPLYALGENCGGNFRYTQKGIKDCTNCLRPHIRENYPEITAQMRDILELVRKK